MDDFSFYLYILRCSDGSYYTGIARNVERRLTEHDDKINTIVNVIKQLTSPKEVPKKRRIGFRSE